MSEGEITVAGYQLKNCVASGNTTQIWEVEVPGSPAQLAMKLMLDDARKIAAEKAVLKHEYKIGKQMTHQSFLRFHEMEMNRDHAFFVMDFFRSPSLKTHITSNLTAVQSSFQKLSASLIQAFHFMHSAGFLHRDIKPDNILVNRAGESRVIDFSLSSRSKGKLGMMVAGKQKSIQGTRTYIAPETILRKPPTEQTDLYSLGVTFFEVLTGQPPFAGDTPNDLLKKHLGDDVVPPSVYNPNVTKELDKVILKMLEKSPAKRFQSMQELESAMRSVRCWEVDPLQLQADKAQAAKDEAAKSVDVRLDSRADADRRAKGLAAPAKEKSKKEMSKLFLREEEQRKANRAARGLSDDSPEPAPASAPPAAAPVQQPQPQMPYPQMPMQQPGMMQPGMPYPQMPMQPGMMQPGMMQPGMPYPQMPMSQPGMPQPGYPYPGQQMPVPPQPGQQVPGMPQPVPPPQPQAEPAVNPQPPAPAPVAQTPAPPAPVPPPVAPPAAPPEEPQEATLDDFLIE